ncbi:hypothetical protein R1T08_14880 [Streptomyces sp. SBC-4]|nr:hypothetical protein [Streptomyces sp. SBC-4]MDV5145461.1 hypothetical protein [Streptomyces sp. SBC-4]
MATIATEDVRASLTKEADLAAGREAAPLKRGSGKAAPSTAIARTGVLSAHVLGFDIHNATVRLWTTAVRGNTSGGGAPQASFRSVTVTLGWEDNDWKLKSKSEAPGLVAPIDFRQSTSLTRDFANYAPKLASDPIVSGAISADGFPAAYERTESGARAAATSASMLYGDSRFFTDAGWRHRMLAATASSGVLAATRAETDSTARLVSENRGLDEAGRTADGGLLVTRTAVLATRKISYSAQAASIELWTTSVGGIAGDDETQRPQVAYLRMTVDLVWADGTWRTTSVTPSDPLVPAPASASQVTPSSRFAEVGGVTNAPATA